MCSHAFINLERHTLLGSEAVQDECPVHVFACMFMHISAFHVYMCNVLMCVSIWRMEQHSALSGVTCVSYLIQISLVRAFKANCVYARALMFSFLCFSAASFSCVCVFSRLFQSAIPLVRTQTLFLLSNANPPLHFAFLQSSPSLYSEAPSLYSHSYAGARTHNHTCTLSSLPVMLCCLFFPLQTIWLL